MKKILLLSALALGFAASAQKGWQLGFELAPGYYTMLNEMDKNADPQILAYNDPDLFSAPHAWAAGAKAFYGLTKTIALQTGLRYSWGKQDYTYGYGDYPGGGTENGTISTELNYLQVPLLFSWNTESKSGGRFYASVGVAPAWLFAYYENTSLEINSPSSLSTATVVNTSKYRSFYSHTLYRGDDSERSSYNETSDELYKSFNLFFTAEAGFRIPLENGWNFNIAVNYYQSLLNPDNIDSERWQNVKYTRNEWPRISNPLLEPNKYDRPKTTLMTIGISLGLLYEFDW